MKAESYIQDFILLFGFLEGLWIRVGVSPEGAIAEALVEAIKSISSEYSLLLYFVFLILSTFAFIATLRASLDIGGLLGFIAVILAMISGALLSEFGMILLFIAIFLGFIAPDLS